VFDRDDRDVQLQQDAIDQRDANAEDDGKPARFMAATEYQLRDAAAWAVSRSQ